MTTEVEVKEAQTAFIQSVSDWKKENPDWDSNKFFLKAIESVSPATVTTYRSIIPKFCTFVNMTPDEIILKRAQDVLTDDPDIRQFWENRVKEFKDVLISLHYKGNTVKSGLGYTSGLFTNNSLPLNLPKNFYDENSESEYIKMTTQKYVFPPTNEEIRDIYAVADLDTQAMILLGYHCAMNPIDVVKTSWDQIGVKDWENEDRDWIPVKRERSKTDVGFFWFVGPDLKYVLKSKWVKDGKPEKGFLFPKRVEKKGARTYDPNQYLSSNKINEKFKQYVNLVLDEKRAGEISFTDLRDSFNDIIASTVTSPDIKEVLMGHVRSNAKKSYKINPSTLLPHYQDAYDKLTVNGWKFQLKAQGYDSLESDLLDMKKIVVRLDNELDAYKIANQGTESENDQLRAQVIEDRARLAELENSMRGLIEYVKVLKGAQQ